MAVNNVNYTDSLREGTDKINQSINQSNKAIDKANLADSTANSAINAANLANTISNDTQQQLNTIVIESGTSDAEVLQARGSYSVLNERLEATDTQLTENTSKVGTITDRTFINKNDVARLKSFREENKSIKFAILGDSTKSGVGWRFGASEHGYAEMGDIDKPTSPEQFFLNFLMSSPYFIKPSKNLGGSQYFYKKGESSSGATSLNWDRYVGIFSSGSVPRLNLSFKHFPVKRNKLTVYYLARTSDGAGKADVVVNGVTTTFDTYIPPVSYNGVSIPQQGFRLGSLEVSIPTNVETIDVLINNFRKGGSPNPVDGTINIVGFYYGEPPLFKNYSIRATTLTDNSIRNQNKGITTTERLQKAYDFGANVFYLGWGTNDATDGVSASSFGTMLRQRIDEIRTFNPNAIIFLDSAYPDPGGLNIPIFEEVKKIAFEKDCSFIDMAGILLKYQESDVINDFVHQNQYGYMIISDAMSEFLSTPKQSEVISKSNNSLLVNDYNVPVEVQAIAGKQNATLTDDVILTANINLKGNPTIQMVAKLALESSADFTDTRFRLAVTQYAELNQQTEIGYEVLDATRFHLVFPTDSTTTRQGSAVLLALKKFNNASSVKIQVLGMNYKLTSSVGYTSKLSVTFH